MPVIAGGTGTAGTDTRKILGGNVLRVARGAPKARSRTLARDETDPHATPRAAKPDGAPATFPESALPET